MEESLELKRYINRRFKPLREEVITTSIEDSLIYAQKQREKLGYVKPSKFDAKYFYVTNNSSLVSKKEIFDLIVEFYNNQGYISLGIRERNCDFSLGNGEGQKIGINLSHTKKLEGITNDFFIITVFDLSIYES